MQKTHEPQHATRPQAQAGKITVFIADDHAILRHGLRRILESESDMIVVGEAANGADAVSRVRNIKPDIVIMDISMPEQDGVESMRQIVKNVGSRVLMLSVHLEHQVISESVAAGASGYLAKDSLDVELVAAIRSVMHGGAVFSPSVSRILAESAQSGGSPNARSLKSLTSREREVFILLAEGKSPTQAGEALFVSPKTIHTHRQHILEKLGLRTTTELIRFALREGLIKSV